MQRLCSPNPRENQQRDAVILPTNKGFARLNENRRLNRLQPKNVLFKRIVSKAMVHCKLLSSAPGTHCTTDLSGLGTFRRLGNNATNTMHGARRRNDVICCNGIYTCLHMGRYAQI